MYNVYGEFNSLRTMGIKCPISVTELIKSAKRQARSIHVKPSFPTFNWMKRVSCIKATYKRFWKCLIHIPTLVLVCFNKAIPFKIGQPVCGHAAVPLAEVHWLHEFMADCQVSFDNAVYMF